MTGIRGAIAEVTNTSIDIIESSKDLFKELLELNNLKNIFLLKYQTKAS